MMIKEESEEQKICCICEHSDIVEPFQINMCGCVGALARKHYSCVVELICNSSDRLCPHCNRHFKDRRIQRFHVYSPSIIEYVIHSSGVYLMCIWFGVNVLFAFIYNLSDKQPMLSLLTKRTAFISNLVIIWYSIHYFFTTNASVVRWLHFERSTTERTIRTTLDLFVLKTHPNQKSPIEGNPRLEVRKVAKKEEIPKNSTTLPSDSYELSSQSVCRVCLKDNSVEPLITACACSGHNQYFHYNCLIDQMTETLDQKCQFCCYRFQDKRIQRLPNFEQFLSSSVIGGSIVFYNILRSIHFVAELYIPSTDQLIDKILDKIQLDFKIDSFYGFWFVLETFCWYFMSLFIYMLWFRYQSERVLEFRVTKEGKEEVHRFRFSSNDWEFDFEDNGDD